MDFEYVGLAGPSQLSLASLPRDKYRAMGMEERVKVFRAVGMDEWSEGLETCDMRNTRTFGGRAGWGKMGRWLGGGARKGLRVQQFAQNKQLSVTK
jgi:hypothetical protein